MSAIASTDVTYTLLRQEKDKYKKLQFTIAFGDGALTYPAGGIPLDANKLGCPYEVRSLQLFSPASADGLVYKYDAANNKIRIYQAPAQTHTHDILLKDAAQADGATTRVNAAANKLGANTGGDLTITGGGANGGIVSKTLAAAAMTELASAPAATTLYLEVIGW